ncbi:unnamed protein product [Closterium sp. NIES-53]
MPSRPPTGLHSRPQALPAAHSPSQQPTGLPNRLQPFPAATAHHSRHFDNTPTTPLHVSAAPGSVLAVPTSSRFWLASLLPWHPLGSYSGRDSSKDNSGDLSTRGALRSSGTLRSTVTIADASLSFTLDHNYSTVTPLAAPIPVALADPTSGPADARSSTTLPCPAIPSSVLTGLYISSFSWNLVGVGYLQDHGVTVTFPAHGRTAICTSASARAVLAMFTREHHSCLFILHTLPPQVAASCQVTAPDQVVTSCQVVASCSYRSLYHPTVLWHHRLGHPSLLRLCSMASERLVPGLPRVFESLPRSPALPCTPCDKGRLRATPHSSSLCPATTPFQTLHLDIWGPAPFLCLHSDRGGEFRFNVLAGSCDEKGITQLWMLPESLQQNGVAERRIGDRPHLHDPCPCTPFFVALRGSLRRPPAEPLASCLTTRGFTDQSLDRGVGAGGACLGGARAGGAGAGGAGAGGAGAGGTGSGGAGTGGSTRGAGAVGAGGRSCSSLNSKSSRSCSNSSSSRSSSIISSSTSNNISHSNNSNHISRHFCSSCSHLRVAFWPLVFPPLLLSAHSLLLHTSPPPVVPHDWTTRCHPLARPSSHIDDLRTVLFHSSPCRSPTVSVLPPPPESPLTISSNPITDYNSDACPVVTHVLSSLVTNPCASPSSVSVLTSAVTDFAATRRLDYATRVVVSPPTCPLSARGEFALRCDVLEDRQFELEFLAAASPSLYAMMLSPEGDPDALVIPTLARTVRQCRGSGP